MSKSWAWKRSSDNFLSPILPGRASWLNDSMMSSCRKDRRWTRGLLRWGMWRVVAERIKAPDSSPGVSDQQSVDSSPQLWYLWSLSKILVSLSKTLNHYDYYCFLRMGFTAVWCCVNPVHLSKREGICPGVPGLIAPQHLVISKLQFQTQDMEQQNYNFRLKTQDMEQCASK